VESWNSDYEKRYQLYENYLRPLRTVRPLLEPLLLRELDDELLPE